MYTKIARRAAARVRVRRPSGTSNEILVLLTSRLRPVPTPKGWMSPPAIGST